MACCVDVCHVHQNGELRCVGRAALAARDFCFQDVSTIKTRQIKDV